MTFVVSGKVCGNHERHMRRIQDRVYETCKDETASKHMWVVDMGDAIRDDVWRMKTCRCVVDPIRKIFGDRDIRPVEIVDELYWSASPLEASGSDKSLVKCHRDGPFDFFPSETAVWYRIIIAINDNDDVITHFPKAGMSVKMSKGDFHGLHYDRDTHCVEGSIPKGKYRIIMKIHYLITPRSQTVAGDAMTSIYALGERAWANASRNVMNASVDPKNSFERGIAFFVNFSTQHPHEIMTSLVIVTILIFYFVLIRKGRR
jgi:hypothetical protein